MNIVRSYGLIFPQEAQCPVVDDLGEKWRIYYGRRDKDNRSRIYYFEVSKDDLYTSVFTAFPIVRLGAEGSFDEHGQIPSSIATINGVKWLYFTGVRKGGEQRYTNAIGAIRIEEEGFFKLKEPVMERRSEEWFSSHLIASNNGFGFCCSCREWRNNEPIYDIHMATSNGGDDWAQTEETLRLVKGEGGICGFNLFGTEAVFCVRGKEDYRGGGGSYRLETAEWNLEGWKRTGRLEMPNEGWNSEMQCYPYIVNNLMFYNGNQFGKTGIGCVEIL